MLRYALASHVYACLDDNHIVLLDLKRDRYFSFAAASARGLAGIVAGWPRTPDGHGADVAESERIAATLIEKGLLTHANTAVEGTAPLALPAAMAEVSTDDDEASSPRRAGHIAAFLSAIATAVFMLRCRSLQSAVHRVRRRRARRAGIIATAFDIERTRKLIAVFVDLRPFLFTSRDACLFESLVLLEFLARYGIFPGWVFGVRARPFAAHCWVQEHDTVLNDTLEHISRYTPIMAV